MRDQVDDLLESYDALTIEESFELTEDFSEDYASLNYFRTFSKEIAELGHTAFMINCDFNEAGKCTIKASSVGLAEGGYIRIARGIKKISLEEILESEHKDFFTEMDLAGVINLDQLEKLIEKKPKARRVFEDLEPYINGDETFLRFEANSSSQPLVKELSEMLKLFVITETDEGSHPITDDYCPFFSNGFRHVNRMNFYLAQRELREDFCDYDI